jgi:hypothetical protein
MLSNNFATCADIRDNAVFVDAARWFILVAKWYANDDE